MPVRATHARGLHTPVTRHSSAVQHNLEVARLAERIERLDAQRAARVSGAQPVKTDVTWVCGLTTVPSRLNNLLPRTLASLESAGFPKPRLFVDGTDDAGPWKHFGLPITPRDQPILPYGNWILGLAEVYVRDPNADRYAMFQDDVVFVKNLRYYLDKQAFPRVGYWNLYTFPENQPFALAPPTAEAHGKWFVSNQRGKGALALVFSQEGVRKLLTHQAIVDKPAGKSPKRWRNIDGAVIHALGHTVGWLEYCHNPSLVQHTGIDSSLTDFTPGETKRKHPLAITFPGEQFDATVWNA